MPVTRCVVGQAFVLCSPQNHMHRTLRDEVLHIRQRDFPDGRRLELHAFLSAAVERPLRVFLPAAAAGIRDADYTNGIRVGHQPLQHVGKIDGIARGREVVGDGFHVKLGRSGPKTHETRATR